MKSLIAYFDIEVNPASKQLLDIGCVLSDESSFHKNQPNEFKSFIEHSTFICGHNILVHDLIYLQKYFGNNEWGLDKAIDTLLFSPLLFPQQPYHHLLKDDKLQTDELNNPLNDAIKAKHLFFDEVRAFQNLDDEFKEILYLLLCDKRGFGNFFKYLNYTASTGKEQLLVTIRKRFKGKICDASDLQSLIHTSPIAFAYALALLNCNDRYSITPPWVLKNYPDVERFLFLMRNNPCIQGCEYCKLALDPIPALKKHFGFSSFRTYGSEPLQEDAVNAAIRGESILAVFPTGGGKSITFQVPALMSGENAKALTVVISPLQSLMKDQVDNLEKKGITEAVTINGLLDPIERSKAIERIENGFASLLYISPESLRSVTIERLLLKRKITRFVIDEAHCFSSWGQDFRVDYLYIGDFIKALQQKKGLDYTIPVSCFTATAKQKVIEDIKSYFKEKLNLSLQVFRANASRTNLQYSVYRKDNEEEKYNQLRSIIETKGCPTIVYVSRTKRAYKLAKRLSDDGFIAKPYHGKMEKDEKSQNQNNFMSGEVNIMVATSAFGMGVDKSDVGAVIHYDISDSLENYVQEAGRAGRDENINADCYVLFNEEDLDKHFILLNQTKISSKEINQIWKAIKELTKTRDKASNSALEIARKAGWDDGVVEIETRVTTAIAALEDAGYLKRGQNMPRIFANSILSKNAQEAIGKINSSEKFSDIQKVKAVRIIKKLFSSKSKRLSTDEIAESRIDYISDQLGIVKEEVIRIIELMREEKILAQARDLTAFIKKADSVNKSLTIVESFRKQEELLLAQLKDGEAEYHLKEIIELFLQSGVKDSSLNKLKTIINFWSIKNWIKRQNLEYSRNHVQISLFIDRSEFREKQEKRHLFAKLVTEYLYKKATELSGADNKQEEVLIEFSVQELKEMAEKELGMFFSKATFDDIEDTLFYLSRIEAIKIEGGFLVVHNKLTIDRVEKNNRIQYKESDYEKLKQFYQQKVQQIHIVGEYAKKMIRNYNEALQFVDDYFRLNYSSFLSKYFPGSRQDEIKRTLTPEKFMKLFGALSPAQLQIINDSANQYIVVAAGPGSGKTRLLVHKLASLLLTEDVKHEQLLMLTFSRAAATEFKKRLIELIGNAANFIEIKTFHSYCFDLLGRVGTLLEAGNIINTAVEKIRSGEIETFRITKTVLVVDEAQDMNKEEYELVKGLMEQNEEMRVILVGDDDQNIYGFRGADAVYMQQLITEKAAVKYELTENYRSKENIVSFANTWATTINNRLKTEACFAKQRGNGQIEIAAYATNNLIVPVSDLISKAALSGSTCVLTKTNEDAMLLAGLLLLRGVQAKVIQSNDGFSLSNLYELRYFSDIINGNTDTPLITEEDWINAKRQLNAHINASAKKELVNALIKSFEVVNTARKYKSDWKSFLFESKVEDFLSIDSEVVYASTIHKAKGKEFDNIYLLLRNFNPETDEDKRQFYVAITRAKTNLSIHYTGNYLKPFYSEELVYKEDRNSYHEPQQVAIFLTHRDVQLGYFEFVQHRINNLHSGASLQILEEGLGNSHGDLVCKYSQKFRVVLKERADKGFYIAEAKVNFIVYWKDDAKDKESKIILPELLLKKV
ncbi:RecQ family ATP-dependent DNA helicase [Pseudoflavitalea sp. G-6-1-2]|uniref:RecQ family ATP-dependent DNA helicase n=1 Tax=Pseudoflavitalea sp. G-6-1-2 TaxID=2728841 RepID=UPI00146A3CFA|nr:RecQ family ATP-dependent DNA helicase [Pseudoflavitalea sp. G-6-1-2]NML21796.1 RecQ family ATP-dependent DNA helicase [Pseudoflavitalea sp. G-6-1-2]